jgi:hypothetical protein
MNLKRDRVKKRASGINSKMEERRESGLKKMPHKETEHPSKIKRSQIILNDLR